MHDNKLINDGRRSIFFYAQTQPVGMGRRGKNGKCTPMSNNSHLLRVSPSFTRDCQTVCVWYLSAKAIVFSPRPRSLSHVHCPTAYCGPLGILSWLNWISTWLRNHCMINGESNLQILHLRLARISDMQQLHLLPAIHSTGTQSGIIAR